MSRGPLVSVVTPVHNTAAHLAECIESVLEQTHQHFEYIIVENQSTDGSGEIADHYAARDERIRVVRTDRLLPQVANYNFALARIASSSDYTKICQADDRLLPGCLEQMVAVASANPSAGLVSSYRIRGAEVDNTGLSTSETVIDGREVCARYFLDGLYVFGSPSTVMYRSDLVRNRAPFFEEGRLHEDTEVCFELLETTDLAFVHEALSYSRLDSGSIMGGFSEWLPGALDRVIITKRYASRYLDPRECRQAQKAAIDEYYASLARRTVRGLVVRNGPDFWQHQRRALGLAEERLRVTRICSSLARLGLDTALSPVASLRSARRWSKRRKAKSM